MGSASQAAALRNADKNYRMLKYAKSNFNSDLYKRIYKEYKLAKWSQLSLPLIFLVLVLILCIFVPSEEMKLMVFAGGSLFFIFLIPIWIVICNCFFARKWRMYVKWYDEGTEEEEVYNIFGMTNK